MVEGVATDFEFRRQVADVGFGEDVAGGAGAGDVEGGGDVVLGEEAGEPEVEGVAVIPTGGDPESGRFGGGG